MLTDNEITSAFLNKVGEPPADFQIELYKELTIEELNKILDRRIAIDQDPTYPQRLAEDYRKFLKATPEEQLSWKTLDPIISNNN